MTNARTKAAQFLAVAGEFKLGNLSTESSHPLTKNLSHLSQQDLTEALRILKEIDRNLFSVLRTKADELQNLYKDIWDTLDKGGNIFLCGCGATGRLSINLETLWRQEFPEGHPYHERVVSFMAGGDVALIHSIETFEDYPEYGARQLTDLNFGANDLLISCTEGGETPFVIGATLQASEISQRAPYFLYCNPNDILTAAATRSEHIISNPAVIKVNLDVGPMALAGSTRMQASTILMAAVGLPLLNIEKDFAAIKTELDSYFDHFDRVDFSLLDKFITCESAIYSAGGGIVYETDELLGVSILTDTTERSPTFSLQSFENKNDSERIPSLNYIYLPETANSEDAWKTLLKRSPRTFEWEWGGHLTGDHRLLGFDFSKQLFDWRQGQNQGQGHAHPPYQHIFKIYHRHNTISFSLNSVEAYLYVGNYSRLFTHLLLKVLLNNLSTLVMGRLGRYHQNLMTWVRPSNNKLIDRTLRYAQGLLAADDIHCSYEELATNCFELMEHLSPQQPIVLELVKRMRQLNQASNIGARAS